MLKAYLLRFHRWISILFALPLAIIIVTGLILSFQPLLQTAAVKPGSVTLAQVEALFAKHDPEGKARSLRIDPYEKSITLGGVGPDGSLDLDLATGAEADDDSWLTELVSSARPIHEHLVFDLSWLVPLSTAAMLVTIGLGVFMGWPQFSNSLSGWHKATAWILLPLLIASPLTGLFMAYRITFASPSPRAEPAPVLDVVRMVAAKHDLSGLVSIRSRGPTQMVRVIEGASTINYVAGKNGLAPAPSNWPRTLHEGTFMGYGGSLINILISLAFALLLSTGLLIWSRRTLRLRARKKARVAVAAE